MALNGGRTIPPWTPLGLRTGEEADDVGDGFGAAEALERGELGEAGDLLGRLAVEEQIGRPKREGVDFAVASMTTEIQANI
jgi:hypothetical protein